MSLYSGSQRSFSSSSSSSRTSSWLDSLPSLASDYSDLSSTSISAKRRKVQKQEKDTPGALRPVSPNLMAPSPRKDPKTPTKRLKDDDETPTQGRPHPLTAQSLNSRSIGQLQTSPTRRSGRLQLQKLQQDSGSSASTSSASGGYQDEVGLSSSLKEVAVGEDATHQDQVSSNAATEISNYLHLDGYQIVKSLFTQRQFEFPPPRLENLTMDILAISRGLNIIPHELKERAFAEMLLMDRNDVYVNPQSITGTVQLPTDQESINDFWKELLKAYTAAQECDSEEHSEASWNDEVHSRLLRLALQDKRTNNHIWYRNVTTHRITREVKPQLSGSAQDGSMVDFTILIEPPNETLDKLLAKFPSDDLNQTRAKDLQRALIAANIETKVQRGGGDRAKAIRQLSVWTLAAFRKIMELNPKLNWSDLPTMPVILTEVHTWTLLALRMIDERTILVHIGSIIGTTDNIRGIFQIIATIQRLAQWSKEDYMDWWKKNILEPN